MKQRSERSDLWSSATLTLDPSLPKAAVSLLSRLVLNVFSVLEMRAAESRCRVGSSAGSLSSSCPPSQTTDGTRQLSLGLQVSSVQRRGPEM